MTVARFPFRGPAGRRALKDWLRKIVPGEMTNPDIIDLCRSEVPGCSLEDISAALREIAAEYQQEVEELYLAGGRA